MKLKYIMPASLALAFALASPHMAANAAKVAPPSLSHHSVGYAVSDGPVVAYGQTLNPQNIKFQVSKYTWKDLKNYMPIILPDAHRYSLSAEEVCDRFHTLKDQYLEKAEEDTNYLTYKMEFAVRAGKVEPPADLALSDRLTSPSPQAMDELKRLLPGEDARLAKAKDSTLKSLAMILLYDAALDNCPEYEYDKNKGYAPVY